MDVITCNTQSFSLTIVTAFTRIQENVSAFIFLYRPEKDITGSSSSLKWSILDHFVSFDETPQQARLYKVKVALLADLNTARWFAKMDLSASVQKQQGRLLASAVKRELTMPWK